MLRKLNFLPPLFSGGNTAIMYLATLKPDLQYSFKVLESDNWDTCTIMPHLTTPIIIVDVIKRIKCKYKKCN